MTQMQVPQDDNWKAKTYLIGALIGAGVGLTTAALLAKSSDENLGGPPRISSGDLLKLSIGVLGMMRGIAALGD